MHYGRTTLLPNWLGEIRFIQISGYPHPTLHQQNFLGHVLTCSPQRSMSFADGLRTRDRTAQKQLASLYVVSLLYIVVLCDDVEVAQPPLQR
jgi:hypothetical protein